jgi:hypothetical protein
MTNKITSKIGKAISRCLDSILNGAAVGFAAFCCFCFLLPFAMCASGLFVFILFINTPRPSLTATPLPEGTPMEQEGIKG